jgi:hypothetical protein
MNVKYTIKINQIAFYAAGLADALSLDDLALLDLIQAFERQEKSKKSSGYTWIDFGTASAQLPLARSLRSVSGVSRAVKRLVEAGLVETRRVDRAVYARSTSRCRELLGGRAAVPAQAVETSVPQLADASAERQHEFPRRWPQVVVLDELLVNLAPDQADAVVILTVAAHQAGKARSVVDYAAGLARHARVGTLDLTMLPVVIPHVLAETKIRKPPSPSPASSTGSSGEAGVVEIAKMRAALRGG